jgi:hypothetical protein
MMDLDREARALAARVRRRDGPSAADRARLRARLDPIWAAQRASQTGGAGQVAFGMRRAPLASAVFLVSVSFWTAEVPGRDVAANEQVLGQPAAAQLSALGTSPPLAANIGMPADFAPTANPGAAATPPVRGRRAETKRVRSQPTRLESPALQRLAAGERKLSAANARVAPRSTVSSPPAEGSSVRAPHAAQHPTSELDRDTRASDRGGVLPVELASAANPALAAQYVAPELAPAAEREPAVSPGVPARAADPTPVLRGRAFTPQPIGDELSWVDAAQQALNRGEPSAALYLVQQHAFRYPQGALANERRAVQALALCALQRKAAARSVLSDLERTASSSPLVERVRLKCRL